MTDDRYLGERLQALLGPVAELMRDDRVADVMVNPDGKVFVERVGEQIEEVGILMDPSQTLAAIKTLAVITGAPKVSEESPSLAARVPQFGWRFQGAIPPIVASPCISLRKPATRVYPLSDYLAEGRITPARLDSLRFAVAEHENILVVGGTGSGKTTLANAILHEIAASTPADRVVLIEDTPELRSMSSNHVPMVSTRTVTMHELLRHSLRMRPDRIVVGEVRGAEALVVLEAWSTGHPGGVTTVHANSAQSGLDRLARLAAQGTAGLIPRQEVADTVHLVVYCARHAGRRGVAGMIRVRGMNANGEYECENI